MSKDTRWTFTQLAGAKKVLILEDHAAPHGSPRKEDIYREGIQVNEDTVRYAGNPVPTRHIYWQEPDDIELHGYWMDSRGGLGFAIAKKEEVKEFVADMQPVRVTWSDVLDFEGFITSFDPGFEGQRDVHWKMKIKVDVDNFLQNDPAIPNPPHPTTYTNRIVAALSDPFAGLPDLPLDGDLFGALDNLISDINGFTASVANIADQIGGFETALFSELRRFRAGLGQLRTALVKLRNTFDNFKTDAALESQRAGERGRFYDVRSGIEASVVESLRQIASADRQAELAERKRVQAIYVARPGDTWESIARRVYGDASKANALRDANDVPSGQPPQPDATYSVPS